MKTTVDYFKNLQLKRNQTKHIILWEMKELGKDSIKYHKDLLEYISKKKLRNVILCGENMKIALDNINNDKFIFIMNKTLMINYLKNTVQNNDIILIKGSNTSITREITQNLLQNEEN